MGEPKDKIGIKEYTVIALLMIGTKTTDDIPAMLFDSLMNAGWTAPFIAGVIALVPLTLLLHLATKYKEKNLIDICYHLFGKFLGFIVLFILWLIGFVYIALDTATYTDIISTMYFVKTPSIIIYAVLMGVCAYGAKRGLEQIGSVSWAVYPYLQVSLLLTLILTLGQGKASFLFPIFGPGEWEVMKESMMNLSIYMDFLYLFILFPFVKSTTDFRKGTWIAFIVILFNLTITMVSYVMLFDFQTAMTLNYPYHEVIRSIRMGFLINLETFFFPFWLIATFIKFAAYLYINILLFGKLFNINHFEYIIPAFSTLIVFIGMIPETPTFSVHYFKEMVGNIASPMFFFLPILLWILAKIKGDLRT
ncbi:GerAB/ArcD/ProY family transporter [Oceanobacillus salinisoli]|uniref:GerAB/ArcD/ProY family transporter n=1 Tax=Oceanobacillus salinisoli TaxID=2678611 RepID=UPI0012E145C7|nr:endospore germination permease [Oceanobacillus salinisoli]